MMVGFGASTPCLGTMHLGGGGQGFSNIGLGSFGNVMTSLRIAENGGRALISGISIDGSGGMGPTCPPNFPGAAYHQQAATGNTDATPIIYAATSINEFISPSPRRKQLD